MKKVILAGAVIVATTLTVGAFYAKRGSAEPQVVTAPLTHGDIVDTVVATGALEAVTTVQVGSQQSGTLQALYADFNSVVKKGQVIARLEPSLFQSEVDQAQANLTKAIADRDRLVVAAEDAEKQLARARELSARSLIPATDLEAAEVAKRSADAQKNSADAQITQARAALSQAQVNLAKTVITAPIDGFVVSRNVDVGQTVAASFQAPTLFVIAADLTKMQVNAGVDESDIGRVQIGQTVSFHVDAYPNETFSGTVAQVRLNPILQQNVVTYATVISVPNPDLRLKPGMTATVNIETARRDNVQRAPSAALRFRPSPEQLAALARAEGKTVEAAAPSKPEAGTNRIWIDSDGVLIPHDVQAGMTNGTFTELIGSDFPDGTKVVTNIVMAAQQTATTSASPLFPLGGRGGGGRGR